MTAVLDRRIGDGDDDDDAKGAGGGFMFDDDEDEGEFTDDSETADDELFIATDED